VTGARSSSCAASRVHGRTAGELQTSVEKRQPREHSVAGPMDQFQKLEEKVTRVVEMFKRSQVENQSLAQQIEKLKADSKEGVRHKESLEREVQALRQEREDVRSRVEKLLDQVEALTSHDSAG